MKERDVLIVGQGLSGTWLSWWLEQAGLSYRVMDRNDRSAASRYAAGLINPVTGRRLVTTWMIDELMPFAREAYGGMSRFLKEELIAETAVVDFFPTVQMMQAFQKRQAEDPTYLHPAQSPGPGYEQWFRYDLGWGDISPCYLVRTEKLLTAWRRHLLEKENLEETWFDIDQLRVDQTRVEYGDTRYRYILFCDGRQSAQSRFFENLPFALNKGEGLLVEIPGIPQHSVFKKGMSLVPWEKDIFWVGSSYEWSFSDDQPSAEFRASAGDWLTGFLKLPFKVLDHFAALRPATLERRPFVGFHPLFPCVGILNGMGTKGCSLAPYFAARLSAQITEGRAINPLADISRFERILRKPA